MKDLDVLSRIKDVINKEIPTPEIVLLFSSSQSNDSAFQYGVQVVKNEISSVLFEVLKTELDELKERLNGPLRNELEELRKNQYGQV